MNTSGWFYVEPYVHVSIKSDRVLLYNTLNGAVIEDDYPPVVRLVKRLRSDRNLLVVRLTSRLVADSGVARFLQKAREAFVGDMLDEAFSRGKPIEMMPKLHMQRNNRRMVYAGQDVMAYLTEISLYINNSCDGRCRSCRDAYRQFLACTRGTGHIQELANAEIAKLFEETKGSGLFRVNILGGDIFQHSRFADLGDLLSKVRALKVYISHYANLLGRGESLSRIAGDRNAELQVLVDFPLDEERFGLVLSLLSLIGVRYGIDFIVQDESDLEAAEEIVSELNTERVSFKACYNGTNAGFLENALFLSREDILKAKPALGAIFARMALNPLDFGRLVVFSDGTVRANINRPALGRLGRDSLHELVYKEMVSGNAWRALRTPASACKTCTYNLLCPPRTNYESVLGRSDLCHIQRASPAPGLNGMT